MYAIEQENQMNPTEPDQQPQSQPVEMFGVADALERDVVLYRSFHALALRAALPLSTHKHLFRVFEQCVPGSLLLQHIVDASERLQRRVFDSVGADGPSAAATTPMDQQQQQPQQLEKQQLLLHCLVVRDVEAARKLCARYLQAALLRSVKGDDDGTSGTAAKVRDGGLYALTDKARRLDHDLETGGCFYQSPLLAVQQRDSADGQQPQQQQQQPEKLAPRPSLVYFAQDAGAEEQTAAVAAVWQSFAEEMLPRNGTAAHSQTSLLSTQTTAVSHASSVESMPAAVMVPTAQISTASSATGEQQNASSHSAESLARAGPVIVPVVAHLHAAVSDGESLASGRHIASTGGGMAPSSGNSSLLQPGLPAQLGRSLDTSINSAGSSDSLSKLCTGKELVDWLLEHTSLSLRKRAADLVGQMVAMNMIATRPRICSDYDSRNVTIEPFRAAGAPTKAHSDRLVTLRQGRRQTLLKDTNGTASNRPGFPVALPRRSSLQSQPQSAEQSATTNGDTVAKKVGHSLRTAASLGQPPASTQAQQAATMALPAAESSMDQLQHEDESRSSRISRDDESIISESSVSSGPGAAAADHLAERRRSESKPFRIPGIFKRRPSKSSASDIYFSAPQSGQQSLDVSNGSGSLLKYGGSNSVEPTTLRQSHSLVTSEKSFETTGSGTLTRDKDTAGKFRETLNNPDLLKLFTEFCQKMYCEENLYFWLDIAEFRRRFAGAEAAPADSSSQEEMRKETSRIFQTYIAVGATRELNIDSRLRSDIKLSVIAALAGWKSEPTVESALNETLRDASADSLGALARSAASAGGGGGASNRNSSIISSSVGYLRSDLFDGVQRVVFDMMTNEAWFKFVKSESFLKHQQLAAAPPISGGISSKPSRMSMLFAD